MTPQSIIQQLEANGPIFKALFHQKGPEQYHWKPDPAAWSLLEIICHLYDEEREDFRTRVVGTLLTPEQQPPSIDPVGWVLSRKYAEQNYEEKLISFINERTISIEKLRAFENPNWENAIQHPRLGTFSAYKFLANWLAHDYHHIRQVNRRLYEFLKEKSGVSLAYAGDW